MVTTYYENQIIAQYQSRFVILILTIKAQNQSQLVILILTIGRNIASN